MLPLRRGFVPALSIFTLPIWLVAGRENLLGRQRKALLLRTVSRRRRPLLSCRLSKTSCSVQGSGFADRYQAPYGRIWMKSQKAATSAHWF